jgi:NAD-dependent dihydropyrimidine dehydrogenase PreA subunit
MKHSHLKNVATLSYDSSKCAGCERCVEVCPHRVFGMEEKKARVVERDACMECGACALNCPTAAIKVNAGVGCAVAILMGWLTGKEPTCGCSDGGCC